MAETLEDDGITIIEKDIEEMQEDVDYCFFETDEPVELGLGETAGHPVTTEAQHFIVAEIDVETDEMQQAMGAPSRVQEASVFISNEDGEVGAGLEDIQIRGEFEEVETEDGETEVEVTERATKEDAIERFVETYL